jgi:hypothetical protein
MHAFMCVFNRDCSSLSTCPAGKGSPGPAIGGIIGVCILIAGLFILYLLAFYFVGARTKQVSFEEMILSSSNYWPWSDPVAGPGAIQLLALEESAMQCILHQVHDVSDRCKQCNAHPWCIIGDSGGGGGRGSYIVP